MALSVCLTVMWPEPWLTFGTSRFSRPRARSLEKPGTECWPSSGSIRQASSISTGTGLRRPGAHAAYFANVITRLGTCPYGPEESETIVAVETEFDNIRQAFGWCLTEERWDRVMEMLDALVPELVLRDRIEVGRWAAETLATLGETEHPVLGVASALAANMALVEGRFTDAESLGLQSLACEKRLGGPPTWLARNVVALLHVPQVRISRRLRYFWTR